MKTLFINTQKLIMFVFLLSTALLFAQKAETPDQNYDLGSKINEMTLTIGGVLVVATNDGLVGIKPTDSQPVFTFNNFGKLKPEETDFIPSSPYVVVSQGVGATFAGISKTKRAVIDYVQGRVIFNSENDNWNQIYTCNVVLPQNKLIVSGIQKEGDKFEKITPKVAVYDLATSQLDYSFFLDKPGRVGMAKDFSVTGVPLLLKDFLIIPTAQGLIAKSHSGDDLWQTKIKGVNWMVADQTESEIYGFESVNNGKNTRIHKIGKDGSELWKDDRKIQGVVSKFEILPQGLAVVSNKGEGSDGGVFSQKSESEIAFLSTSSGEDLWEKAPKTKGYVQHFYIMEDGILFGIYSGGINKVSFDGKPLFKKPLKTGENIITMAHSPQGLIYITSEDANIVNLETGDEVWAKPLKYKSSDSVASTFDSDNNRYLIVADGTIFAIDADSGNVSELSNIKFEEKESPNTMAIKNGNIFIGSSQNMMLLDNDGKEIYHSYQKSPGKSGFMKVVGGVVAAASLVATVSTAAAAGANNNGISTNNLRNYNDYGKDAKRASDMFASISDASFKMMAERFKASSATENAQFILTNLDSGVGLVKVNKDTGEIDKEILLKDKKPEYKVDEYGGYLFYKASDDTIYTYNLNK
ncbi:outer membrane protein assembly factor BamB family protein [Winogradskyella helgolandensis]|uniref:outer membrane protein assembly factor BamB family protein n=1 Tax=Winogradskyella helgolandensis TaxID=2697010 RepID=UPI0015CD5940|nr:PQQ-binding-like beta-propeller repeat protein [Winogradskyella helgolandensis]